MKPLRFSTLQLVSLTTAIGAIAAFCTVLVWPPLGSSGLPQSLLAAIVLIAAIWFCGRCFQSRMVMYAIVWTSLASWFFAKWWLEGWGSMDHYHRPPTWIIAAFASACIGLAANIGWWAAHLITKRERVRLQPTSTIAVYVEPSRLRVWLTACVLLVFFPLAAFVAYKGVNFLPEARNDLDNVVKNRLQAQSLSVRQWAELVGNKSMPFRPDLAQCLKNQSVAPKDIEALPALTELLSDDDPEVRFAAASKIEQIAPGMELAGEAYARFPIEHPEVISRLVVALNSEDPRMRWYAGTTLKAPCFANPAAYGALPKSIIPVLADVAEHRDLESQSVAVSILGSLGPAAADAVPELVAVIGKSNELGSLAAIEAIGRIGPSAVSAVPKLSELLAAPQEPAWRSAAARALGAIGPAARPALPAFKKALEEQLLTIEDAQAAYLIDPAGAEALHIPHAAPHPKATDGADSRGNAN
jgi:HEAT repeats/HEAT repeat